MPSRSHGRCKVCRAITHINSRFGLCAVHMRQRNKRIAEERKDAKARRARRLAATIVLEEDQPMADTAAPDKSRRRQLTDEQQVEILDAYTNTDESVNDISARFGIKNTYIYNVLDRVGVSWRRGNSETYEQWQAAQRKPAEETVPEPVEKALENMLRLPVVPPRPEPVAPTPAVERRAHQSAEPLQTWRVQISGFLTIEATSIEEALFEAKRRGGPLVKITYMQLVDS